jgi:hypothetical protein
MYGDFAPISPIIELLNSYKKLHLYADDAHGMSWYGKNGKGFILSHSNNHPKVVVATSFAKAFGTGGGVFVFPSEELCQKVKNCGGPFIFSGPHQIPVIGASIASAKIHLSNEIYERQKALAERITYCHNLLKEYGLPVVSAPETPIFFVGLGLLRVGHNMVKRMMNAGLYVNIAMFPAVPENCTGIRFTITLHHTFKDIETLVKTLARHLPIALAEEERSVMDIQRAFKRVATFTLQESTLTEILKTSNANEDYSLYHERTINNIPKELWDKLMSGKGNFDWKSLQILEETFINNLVPENNWEFHYYIIKDRDNKPVLATFFTVTLAKDDMLSPETVSLSVEQIREKDQYFLTSKSMMMGALVTEGNHLYIDRTNNDWRKILMILVDAAWKEQDKNNASVIIMRDFDRNDLEIREFFKEQGFIMIDLPDAHLISTNNNWTDKQNYLEQFRSDKKYYLKKRVFEFEDKFEVHVTNHPSEEDLDRLYNLYLNIAYKNLEINVFILPKKLFINLAKSEQYEFITLSLKSEYEEMSNSLPIGMAINYQSNGLYCFVLTGLDYNFSDKFNVYPQILWQVVKRANELGISNITLGYTASQNKRKFGAKAEQRTAFIQMKDNFNMNLIEIMSKTSVTLK